jgi:hypothetical protein
VAAATPDTVAETWLVTVALKVPGWASLPLSSSAVGLLSQAGRRRRRAEQESRRRGKPFMGHPREDLEAEGREELEGVLGMQALNPLDSLFKERAAQEVATEANCLSPKENQR